MGVASQTSQYLARAAGVGGLGGGLVRVPLLVGSVGRVLSLARMPRAREEPTNTTCSHTPTQPATPAGPGSRPARRLSVRLALLRFGRPGRASAQASASQPRGPCNRNLPRRRPSCAPMHSDDSLPARPQTVGVRRACCLSAIEGSLRTVSFDSSLCMRRRARASGECKPCRGQPPTPAWRCSRRSRARRQWARWARGGGRSGCARRR